jgi:hypothetical protein
MELVQSSFINDVRDNERSYQQKDTVNSLCWKILHTSPLSAIFCGRSRVSGIDKSNRIRILTVLCEKKMLIRQLRNAGPGGTRNLFSVLKSVARLFEPAGGDGSEDEAPDVGQVGHATGLHLRHCAGVDQLN